MGDREEEEEFEVLDLTALGRDRNWANRIFGDISRQSAAKQVAIGGASGWVSGYLFVKVGKVAAATLGTTVILLQIAQHQGYIQINWSRVNRQMNRARRQLEREATRSYPHVMDNIRRFFQQNVFFAGSFAGGFLLGMAF